MARYDTTTYDIRQRGTEAMSETGDIYDDRLTRWNRRTLDPGPEERVYTVAQVCEDCHRPRAPHLLRRNRHTGEHHCYDGEDCAAAVARNNAGAATSTASREEPRGDTAGGISPYKVRRYADDMGFRPAPPPLPSPYTYAEPGRGADGKRGGGR